MSFWNPTPRRDRSLRPGGICLAAFLVAAVAASPLVADEPEGTPATPVIRLGDNEVEYGELLQGEKGDYEFEVHNDGEGPLIISKLSPSCGCTTVTEFDREIAPGMTGRIRIQVDSKKIKPGDSRKRVRITSNDPVQPRADFYYSVDVTALYRSDPRDIRVSGLYDGIKETVVRLIGTSEHGFELLGVRSRGGLFEVAELNELGVGEYEVRLRVGPAAKPEVARDPLDLLIKVKDGREVQVGQWVNIEHLDAIEVQPAKAIQFGNRDTDLLLREGATPVMKTVTLRSRSPEHSFQVLSVRIEGFPEGVLTTRIDTIEEGKHYKVRLTLPAYREETYLRGKLIIETNSPVQPRRVLNLAAKFGRR